MACKQSFLLSRIDLTTSTEHGLNGNHNTLHGEKSSPKYFPICTAASSHVEGCHYLGSEKYPRLRDKAREHVACTSTVMLDVLSQAPSTWLRYHRRKGLHPILLLTMNYRFRKLHINSLIFSSKKANNFSLQVKITSKDIYNLY